MWCSIWLASLDAFEAGSFRRFGCLLKELKCKRAAQKDRDSGLQETEIILNYRVSFVDKRDFLKRFFLGLSTKILLLEHS